jgi:hypothetical protein
MKSVKLYKKKDIMYFYATFHQVSRDLVTKIPINHENAKGDKPSIQMLRVPPLVCLVQKDNVYYS